MMHYYLVVLALIFNINTSNSCINYKYRNNFGNRHIAALILARGGSKGIPLKNLAKIDDKSLLINTLNTVSRVNFTSIWISTDHDEIIKEARNFNIHYRSKESASDNAASIVGVLDFIKSHLEVDIIALIQCTSPFIREIYLERALKLMRQGADCVFSVTRSFKLRWIQQGDFIIPLNFQLESRPRRQDWDGELIENGMFYFFKRSLAKRGLLQSQRLAHIII